MREILINTLLRRTNARRPYLENFKTVDLEEMLDTIILRGENHD